MTYEKTDTLSEDQKILSVVLGVVIPGVGHIVSRHVRRGTAILIIRSLLALLPNNIGLLLFQMGNFLLGLQVLSDSSMSALNDFSQFLSTSLWSLMILPSIAFWIWQIRDLIQINQGRRQLALPSKKKIIVIIGSIVIAIE